MYDIEGQKAKSTSLAPSWGLLPHLFTGIIVFISCTAVVLVLFPRSLLTEMCAQLVFTFPDVQGHEGDIPTVTLYTMGGNTPIAVDV